MTIKNTCPICGEGVLTRHSGVDTITYKGKIKNVDDHFSTCDFCGVEQAAAEELKLNKRSVIKAKKEVDGLLSGEEIVLIREKLRISQETAAKIFGGGPNAFTKYENNDVTQSESMDKLLRVASSSPSAFGILCEIAGISLNKRITWEHTFSFSGKDLEEFAVESKQLDATH